MLVRKSKHLFIGVFYSDTGIIHALGEYRRAISHTFFRFDNPKQSLGGRSDRGNVATCMACSRCGGKVGTSRTAPGKHRKLYVLAIRSWELDILTIAAGH